ncbi:MAG: tryptophan RNA-binding attenuation protein [Syntrophobacteraceae bacterium]
MNMSLPDLETKCWKCWGAGLLPLEDHGEMVECEECGGIGWIPTEDGTRLLDFLHKHLTIDVDEGE